jgi:hypothetical protein
MQVNGFLFEKGKTIISLFEIHNYMCLGLQYFTNLF